MTTKVKVIIIASSIVALSSILFFTRKLWMKNGDSDNKEKENTGDDKGDNDNGNAGTGNNGGGNTNNGGGSGNPFTNSADILKFQSFAKSKGANLGTSGTSKDGVDGKWGNKTKAAWEKYGSDYKTTTTPPTAGKGVYAVGTGVGIYLFVQNTDTTDYANPVVTGTLIRKTAKANEYLGQFAKNIDIKGATWIGFRDINSGRNVLIIKSGASVK